MEEIIDQINKGSVEYSDLSQNWRILRPIIIASIKKNPDNVNYLPNHYYNDFDIMLMAVRLNGMLLKKVSKNLIQNYYIVHAAVSQNGRALEYVFNYEIEFVDDYEEEYDSHGSYKTFIGRYIVDDSRENLINKESIVLAAVRNYGFALEYASYRLKNNKFIVSEAINTNGTALEFASDQLRRNQELIFKAISNDFNAIYTSYLEHSLKDAFLTIKYGPIDRKMNYLYKNIKDGTLIPYAMIWLKLIPSECHIQLLNWINSNIYDYKNLFNVIFYKHNKFDQRLGHFIGLPQTILSYLVPSQNIRQEQKKILKDIFDALQYYL